MKPYLTTYFLTFLNSIAASFMWIGQYWYFPEVNVWAHFFLSLISLVMVGLALIILGIQKSNNHNLSLVQVLLIVFLNIILGVNGLWFLILSSSQILF